jgi:hypothetical protein
VEFSLRLKRILIPKSATVPTDIVALYSADFISGVIIMGGNPWRSMYSQIVSENAISISSRLLSTNLEVFYKAVREFIDAFFAYPEQVPAAFKFMLMGAVVAQYRGLPGLPAIHNSID